MANEYNMGPPSAPAAVPEGYGDKVRRFLHSPVGRVASVVATAPIPGLGGAMAGYHLVQPPVGRYLQQVQQLDQNTQKLDARSQALQERADARSGMAPPPYQDQGPTFEQAGIQPTAKQLGLQDPPPGGGGGGPAAPAQRWIPTVSPEARTAFDEAEAAKAGVIAHGGQLAAQQGAEQETVLKQIAGEREASRQKYEQDQAKRAADQDAYLRSIMEEDKELRSTKFDADRLWQKKGEGARIAAIMGVALTQFGMALNRQGGPNPALMMVQDALDRDMTEQKMNYEAKRESLGRRVGIYGMLRQKGLDAEQAFTVGRHLLNEKAASVMDIIAARHQGQARGLAAEEAAAGLRAARAQFEMQASVNSDLAAAGKMGGGGGGGLDKQQKHDEEMLWKYGKEIDQHDAMLSQVQDMQNRMGKTGSIAGIGSIEGPLLNSKLGQYAYRFGAALGVPEAREGLQNQQALQSVFKEYMQSGAGKSATVNEIKLAQRVLDPSASSAEIRAGLEVIRRRIEMSKAALQRAAPRAAAQYEENRQMYPGPGPSGPPVQSRAGAAPPPKTFQGVKGSTNVGK